MADSWSQPSAESGHPAIGEGDSKALAPSDAVLSVLSSSREAAWSYREEAWLGQRGPQHRPVVRTSRRDLLCVLANVSRANVRKRSVEVKGCGSRFLV